jgi:cytoskeletal protein CcmA (bactofilin family)
MSACWDSDLRVIPRPAPRTPVPGLALAAALAAVLVVTLPAAAERVRRVEVGPGGVIVERAHPDTATPGARVRVARRLSRGIHIEVDDGGTGIVRVFSDAVVPADERVAGDVVAVFGSVEVLGQVDGDVVAVMGSVHLRDSAMVDGDAVSVGGALVQDEGATVSGETISLGFFPVTWGLPALPVMLAVVIGGWLLAVFMGWIFASLFPARLVRTAATASRRTAASFFVGLLSLPGLMVLIPLLFVTVIGIPLALLMPLVYGLMLRAGELATTYVLGCKLMRRQVGAGSGLMAPLASGTSFVSLFFLAGSVLATAPGIARPTALFFLLLGGLLVLSLGLIGIGAFLLSRLGSRPLDVGWPGRDPIPAPPAAEALGGLATTPPPTA